MNITPKELTPCKISHIYRCAFNQSLNKIMKKKRAKNSITTYDFSTLYRKLPHDSLKNKLSSIFDSEFKGGNNNSSKVFIFRPL